MGAGKFITTKGASEGIQQGVFVVDVQPVYRITEEFWTPRELVGRDSDMENMLVTLARGIGCNHCLYLRYDADTFSYLYLCEVTDGSYSGITRWSRTSRAVPVWTVANSGNSDRPYDDPFSANQMATWRAASEWVTERAFYETEREHSA